MQDLPSTWPESEQWVITHHQRACFLEDRVPNACLRLSEWSVNTQVQLSRVRQDGPEIDCYVQLSRFTTLLTCESHC